jgi:hypothetical protein
MADFPFIVDCRWVPPGLRQIFLNSMVRRSLSPIVRYFDRVAVVVACLVGGGASCVFRHCFGLAIIVGVNTDFTTQMHVRQRPDIASR